MKLKESGRLRLARSAAGKVLVIAYRDAAMRKSIDSSARDRRVARSGRATRRRRIDFSDIPELSDRQLSKMRRVGRPPLGEEARKLIAIRLDPGVLRWLRTVAEKQHVPYQSLINEILAKEMRKES